MPWKFETIHRVIPADQFDARAVRRLADLIGAINRPAFAGHPPGAVQLSGVNGHKLPAGDWVLSFRFRPAPTIEGVAPGVVYKAHDFDTLPLDHGREPTPEELAEAVAHFLSPVDPPHPRPLAP